MILAGLRILDELCFKANSYSYEHRNLINMSSMIKILPLLSKMQLFGECKQDSFQKFYLSKAPAICLD